MSDKYELREGQGSLWHENNCVVVRKGKIKVDGEDRYASILKYTHSDGSEKYELTFSAGLLRINTEAEKLNEKSPDIYGAITFNKQQYKFGGWRNTKDNGEEWTGVKLTPREEAPFPKDKELDSEAPF